MNCGKATNSLVKQLQNFVGGKKVILGVSGGIDSAVVAALCKKSFPSEQIHPLLLSYGDQSTFHAELLCSHYKLFKTVMNIKPIVDMFEIIAFTSNKFVKGNVMARVRMTLLYMYANQLNGMVIGTTNKSELMLGYYTKYGDGGVDIEPIADLYKTEIYELAEWLGVPNSIIKKTPSAGLWEGQTDEEELGISYELIDLVLKGSKNVPDEQYKKVRKIVESTIHKKEVPPIFHINK